jgi:hypothetical protein
MRKNMRPRLTDAEQMARNPVFRATLLQSLQRDLDSLVVNAELQAWNSAHVINTVNQIGRLFWIVDEAARACRIAPDAPELRVMAGAAGALELVAKSKDIEAHRAALQAGVLAAERLWPDLDPFALALACARFDKALVIAGVSPRQFHAPSAQAQPA